MSFTFEGTVGSGNEDGLTFTQDVPVCTEDVAYAVVILSIAEFEATEVGAAQTYGSPPPSLILGVTNDDFTPAGALVSPYGPGCYPEWQSMANHRYESEEELLYFGSDIGFRSMIAGLGVWRYTTRPILTGDIVYHTFAQDPIMMTSTALLFKGVRSFIPPGGAAAVTSGLPIGSTMAWVSTLTGYLTAANDCDGAWAWMVPNLFSFTEQGTFPATGDIGAVFGFARAYGLRTFYGGSDFILDGFDPVEPSGEWNGWGAGAPILMSSGNINYKHNTDPLFAVPWKAEWKMRVTDGAKVSLDMETRWECPGHVDIVPPPAVATRQYGHYPCATWGHAIGKQRTRVQYEGLLGCDRTVYITSDPSVTVPPPFRPGEE